MPTYKIRRRSDGAFSTGTTSPAWSPRGRSWVSLKAIETHVGLIRRRVAWQHKQHTLTGTPVKVVDPYEGCDVVEYRAVEASVRPVSEVA